MDNVRIKNGGKGIQIFEKIQNFEKKISICILVFVCYDSHANDMNLIDNNMTFRK